MVHLHAGPQHEVHAFQFNTFPIWGAHRTGDPHAGGSPENWVGKTNWFTCILGLNMRCMHSNSIHFPYGLGSDFPLAARKGEGERGEERGGKRGSNIYSQTPDQPQGGCYLFYTPTCVKPPPDRLEPSAFSATYPRPIHEFTASPAKNCEWAGVRNDRARRHRAPCKLSAPARTRREYGNQARSTYGEMSRSSRFHIKASPLARALGSYLWPCETLEARCISARCHSPCARNHRPRNATSKAPTRKHKNQKHTYAHWWL